MSDRGKGQLANQEIEEEEIKRLLLRIMEGYNDSVIPPFSYFSPSPRISNNEVGSNSRERRKSLSENQLKERKRREQMSEKFSVLQSMVPSLFNEYKPPKEKIIGDTVDYIKYLQEKRERLEGLMKSQRKEHKMERPVLSKCRNQNSVKFTVSNCTTFLAIELPFKHGSVLDIVKVLEKHQAEVLEARISVNDQQLLTFTATIRLASDGGSTIDKIREELLTL